MSSTEQTPLLRDRFQALNVSSSHDAETLATKGHQVTWWQLVSVPLLTFLRVYGRHCSWRQGIPGLIHALFAAYEAFVCYAKLWERQHVRTTTPPQAPS